MKALRYEICRLLWPKVYTDDLEPGEIEVYSAPWEEPDDNDILEAVGDLLKCRDRFAILVDEVHHSASDFNIRVNASIGDALSGGGLLENIGGEKDGDLG